MTATTQQLEALATANQRRLGVAEFKRETRRLGTRGAAMRVAALLEHEPGEVLGTARIGALLQSVPNLGQRKTVTLLDCVGVRSFDRRVRDLTPRQRTALALALRLWVERWNERAR